MSETIRIQGYATKLSLDKATVIHANKYSRADGVFSYFIFSSLHAEIVFRTKETDEDVPVYTKNTDLPIYSGQDVILIRLGRVVVGYVDTKTNYYYYISNDLARRLGSGISYYWVPLIGVTGGLIFYFLSDRFDPFWIFIPVIAAWTIYTVQKWIFNYVIKKKLDRILRK